MTLKDKLEIGLKEDAAFRKDNLPDFQVRGEQIPAGPGRSPEIPASRTDPVASDAPTVDTVNKPDDDAAVSNETRKPSKSSSDVD